MDNLNQVDKDDYHYKFKIVVLGDVHSGKSTFLDSKLLINFNEYLIFC